VPFAYYRRLSRAQQRIYRESDAITHLALPRAEALESVLAGLARALEAGDQGATQAAAERLLAGLAAQLGVPPLRARILAARPAQDWGELHGLYVPGGAGRPPVVTLWMRTAQRRQVVRFRTFLRTLVHELCHHLDYELLGLPESFHTEGFYKRESSLMRQLLGEGPGGGRRA